MPARRFSIGLTGGIGSGKSTVADQFSGLGAAVVDTDAIAHALTAPGGPAIAPLRACFGADYITPAGALDRTRIRNLVFGDGQAKQQLEAILHPMIRQAAEEQAQTMARQAPYLVFVVPLLVESGSWAARVNRVLVVDCSAATQIARVQRRSQLPTTQIESIMRQQATREARLRAAHDVLFNEHELPALLPRVERLHLTYLNHANK